MPYSDSPQNTTNPFVFLFRQPSMKMQDLMLKFPHLPEQIFQKLDLEGLFKCREVTKSWQDIIDERNYPWLRMVTIPTILNGGNTYLHLAAARGQIEAFKTAFSEEEDKNIKNEKGQTSFHFACMHGRSEIVQVLLENIDPEININTKDNHSRLLDLVNIFMENAAKLSFDNHGIDINAKTKLGRTAFHLACQKGHSDVVKLLMENAVAFCIDLNVKDNSGKTAFLWACLFGHSDVVKTIMKNAAYVNIDLNTKDNYDKTAFLCACQKGHTDVVKILMENAATFVIDINTKDKSGSTGFHWACESGFTDLVKVFMENADKFNIDLNTVDIKGRTAFYRACAKGFSDVVEILMDNAAALNINLNVGTMMTKNGRVNFK